MEINAMIRPIVVNRAQVGINDTPITRALEEGQFKLAQQLIMENTDRSYLDEGPFAKIPLALVLSGDPEFRKHPRHLGLAKLLVEHGANPNLRIPTAELQKASPSPMESLINLLSSTRELLIHAKLLNCVGNEMSLISTVAPNDITNPLRTIGLNGELKLPVVELREQLLTLLDVFLANGGDANVTSTISYSTLYHIVLSEYDPDMEVVLKLCEAGGDLYISNGYGTTPLMDLILYADGDAAFDILKKIWAKNPYISSLESQNYASETALWRAMLSGSPQLAVELLHKGANPGHCGKVYIARWHRIPLLEEVDKLLGAEISTNGVSALFAPLLQQSSPYRYHTGVFTYCRIESTDLPLPFDVNLMNKVMACAVYPIVDNAHISELFTPQVLLELEKLVASETQFNAQDIVPKGTVLQEIGPLLFGNIKAGLQQLCIRQIIYNAFFKKPINKAFELVKMLQGEEDETEAKMKDSVQNTLTQAMENWDNEVPETEQGDTSDWQSVPGYTALELPRRYGHNLKEEEDKLEDHWNLVYKLSPSVIRKLVVSMFGLPSALVPYFEIEAVRLQLGAAMYTYEHVSSMAEWEGMSYEGSTDPFYDLIDDDVFTEGHGDNDDHDDSDDYDDDEADYKFYIDHRADGIGDNSFSFGSSPSTSSEDILLPPRGSKYLEILKNSDTQMVPIPLACSDSDNCESQTKHTENDHETETPMSDNRSSGECIPSDVSRNHYQKLTSDLCSTSSSDMSADNVTNNKETE